jgi:hypothetical protein
METNGFTKLNVGNGSVIGRQSLPGPGKKRVTIQNGVALPPLQNNISYSSFSQSTNNATSRD